MKAQVKLPDDDPMLVAFNEFKTTDVYENAARWATYPDIRVLHESPDSIATISHPHLEGSLWAVFITGWKMALAAKSGSGGSGQLPNDAEQPAEGTQSAQEPPDAA